MRLRILTAIVVLLLLTPPAQARPLPGLKGASTAPPQERNIAPLALDNETVYHGDLVVNGTRKLVIRDVNFTLFGSIIARDWATVIIENAVLTLNLTRMGEYNITIMDHSNLTIRNSLVRSASGVYLFSLYLFNETRAFFEEARFENSLEWYGSAEVVVRNSRVRWVMCYGSVVVNVTDSEVWIALSATDNARVWLWRTVAATLMALSRATIVAVDCVVKEFGIRCYHDAVVRLVNVTKPGGGKPDISFVMADKAVVYVAWHVRAAISLEGEPVEGAEVIAFFPNGSVAVSGLTDADGAVEFALLEAIVRRSGIQYVGNYTLRASYGQLLGEARVEVEDNIDVLIELLATLIVTCLDGDGAPVEGVRLELSGPGAPGPAQVSTSITNASGTCSFPLLSPGSYEVRAFLMGIEVAYAPSLEITAVDVYELVLPCSIYDLLVSVVGPDGSPISGARVVLLLLNGTEVAEATTNASGIAVFENLPAYNYTLSVEADGFAEVSVGISLVREDQLETIKLEPSVPERPFLPGELYIGIAVAALALPLLAVLVIRGRKKAKKAEPGEEGGEEARSTS